MIDAKSGMTGAGRAAKEEMLFSEVSEGFHAYGVSRNMGGWRAWSQSLLNGPPVPAPPSFTGLALAGLAALGLAEHRGHG